MHSSSHNDCMMLDDADHMGRMAPVIQVSKRHGANKVTQCSSRHVMNLCTLQEGDEKLLTKQTNLTPHPHPGPERERERERERSREGEKEGDVARWASPEG